MESSYCVDKMASTCEKYDHITSTSKARYDQYSTARASIVTTTSSEDDDRFSHHSDQSADFAECEEVNRTFSIVCII